MKWLIPFVVLIPLLPSIVFFVHWSTSMILIGLIVGWGVGQRFHWSLGILTSYIICHAAIWQSVLLPLKFKGAWVRLGPATIHANVGLALVWLLLLLLFAIFVRKIDRKWIERTIGWSVILCMGMVLLQWYRGAESYGRGGFLRNSSLQACYIAVFWPFVWETLARPAECILMWLLRHVGRFVRYLEVPFGVGILVISVFLPMVLVLSSDSSVALAVYMVSFCGTLIWILIRDHGWKVWPYLGIGVLFLGGSMTAVAVMRQGWWELFSSNGRVDKWMMLIEHLNDKGRWIFGTGLGVTVTILPGLQRLKSPGRDNYDYFIWGHSDWVTFVYELGLVGLALCLLVYGCALWRTYSTSNMKVFVALMALGVCMLFNYPLHKPVFSFASAMLLLLTFTQEKKWS